MSSVADAVKTAVIIEDDPEIRLILSEVLESAGFSTVAVGNGVDGVRAVLTYRPLLTTLDVRMPGIDGFEAARRIRAQSDTYLIMLTGLQDVNRLDLWDGSTWVAVSVGRSSWTTITPESPWTQNGNNNGTFQYRLLNISGEESLQFRGALGRASYPTSPAGSYVVNNTALPSSVRPSTLRTVLIPCSDTSSERIALKLDVKTDGYLEVFGFSSTAKPPWIGFNGVTVSL